MTTSVPAAAGNNVAKPGVVRRSVARYQVLSAWQKKLLWAIFALVAVLGANSAYLASITFLGWWNSASGAKFEHWFYPWMILFHIAFGLVLAVPLMVFAVTHWRTARHLPNRRAFRMGQALFITSLVVLVSGIVLTFLAVSTASVSRAVTYWLHVISPLVAVWLYVLHRLAGPPIRWRVGAGWAGAVVAALALMVAIHAQDPRKWNEVGPKEGLQYFFPSLSRTASGNFISAGAMMNDQYCKDCHPGVHDRWASSVHRFSSFNNKAYLTSVRETRKVALERDQDVKASRFCAGCHDPVPFFSGAFDNPKFDDVNDPTSQAGITCTVCHSITAVNSDRGNGDYTIEEAIHYPFAFSDNSLLKYINHQLIKAKPSFHKKTFLKPVHQTANFCGTCHKVHLPQELNHYKWLRGQNHYDSFLLSGVSGHGGRSFYYPETAHANCNRCHMPLQPSDDFAAKMFPGAEEPSVHDHLFPGANTAIAHWQGREDIVKAHQEFLKNCLRVDIFGLRAGTNVTSDLAAPLRPVATELKAGQEYVLEMVIRTLTLGHHFTQGTSDSNEVWLDVTVRSGERLIARSGDIDEKGQVDPWSYFVNAYVLDRNGDRIDRRNAQDIFVPLYDHQIQPGGARLARFGLKVPDDVSEPITVDVKVQYRKFDQTYLQYVFGKDYRNDLPVTLIASDRVTLPIAGGKAAAADGKSSIPPWQRWNDYGIAQLLEAQQANSKASDLRAALQAFEEVEKLGQPDGPLNQARVHLQRGYVAEAAEALRRAADFKENPARRWTLAWLWSTVFQRQGQFDAAEKQLRYVLESRDEEMRRRNLDFSRDYMLINELGNVLFERSKVASGEQQTELRRQAVEQFRKTLKLDSENLAAHYNLYLLYGLLGQTEKATEHQELHAKYKPDENARDRVVATHRQKNQPANLAATPGAIHPLHPVKP
jgi:tetratricopeptide (TPR) repeat protein